MEQRESYKETLSLLQEDSIIVKTEPPSLDHEEVIKNWQQALNGPGNNFPETVESSSIHNANPPVGQASDMVPVVPLALVQNVYSFNSNMPFHALRPVAQEEKKALPPKKTRKKLKTELPVTNKKKVKKITSDKQVGPVSSDKQLGDTFYKKSKNKRSTKSERKDMKTADNNKKPTVAKRTRSTKYHNSKKSKKISSAKSSINDEQVDDYDSGGNDVPSPDDHNISDYEPETQQLDEDIYHVKRTLRSASDMKAVQSDNSEKLARVEESINSITHANVIVSEKPDTYSCHYCNFSFTSQRGLNRHIIIHTQINKLQLGDTPENKFSVKVSEKSDKYSCHYCNLSFTSLRGLNRHIIIHTQINKHKLEDTPENKCAEPGESNKESEKVTDKTVVSQRAEIKKNVTSKVQEKEPMICDECGKSFKTTSHFNKHKRMHTGERPYGCSECGKSFTEFCRMKDHMRIHTGERPYVCEICGLAFAQKTAMNIHKLGKHNISLSTVHKCEFCSKELPSPSALQIHRRYHTQERPYVCDICSKAFITRKDLKEHIARHTGTIKFSCPICNKGFFNKSHFEVHKQMHIKHPDKMFNVPKQSKPEKPKSPKVKPNKQIVEEDKTTKEALVIVKGTDLLCDICLQHFKSYKDVMNHKYAAHGCPPYSETRVLDIAIDLVKAGELSCDSLPDTMDLQTSDNKSLHMFSSNSPGSYKCDICSKILPSTSHLVMHVRMHINEKPFICYICSKPFSQRSHCVSHQKIHSDQKEFTCPVCYKGFHRNRVLREHQQKWKHYKEGQGETKAEKGKDSNKSAATCTSSKAFDDVPNDAIANRAAAKVNNEERNIENEQTITPSDKPDSFNNSAHGAKTSNYTKYAEKSGSPTKTNNSFVSENSFQVESRSQNRPLLMPHPEVNLASPIPALDFADSNSVSPIAPVARHSISSHRYVHTPIQPGHLSLDLPDQLPSLNFCLPYPPGHPNVTPAHHYSQREDRSQWN